MVTLSYELAAADPGTNAAQSIAEGLAGCIARLQHEVPFGRWTLTRMIGDDWVMLHGPAASTHCNVVPWAETICARMTRDLRDAFVPADYEDRRVSAPVRRAFDVGAYIGVGLYLASGEPLGSLGSVDTRRRQPPRGRRQLEALRRCGGMIVELIEQGRLLMRCARAATQGMLRQRACGNTRWLPRREWRCALRDEDEVRRPLALPAAVLAVAVKDGALLRASSTPAPAVLERIGAVLTACAPDYIGTFPRGSMVLALLPECDGERARRIEARARVLFDAHGIKVRCRAVSARFDETLRKAEAAALRAIS